MIYRLETRLVNQPEACPAGGIRPRRARPVGTGASDDPGTTGAGRTRGGGAGRKTGLTIANCSQHLQQLRRAALVTSRRDGKAVIYRLTDARTLALMDLLRVVAERNLAQVERILRGLSGGEDAPEPVSREDLPRGSPRGRSPSSMSGPPTNTPPGPHSRRAERDAGGAGTDPVRRSIRTPRSSPIAAAPTASTPIRPSPPCASTAERAAPRRRPAGMARGWFRNFVRTGAQSVQAHGAESDVCHPCCS
jgi:DNA-binding transcriptional ArsR family regulator